MPREALRRTAYDIGLSGGIFLAYWGVSWLNWMLFKTAGVLPMPIWPAAGLAVAFCYRFGARALPGLMAGALMANALTLGADWKLAGIIALMNGLGPFFGVYLARRFSRQKQAFSGMQNTLSFLLWAVAVHAVLTAIGGVGGQVLLGLLPESAFLTSWGRWWLAHAAGTVLFAPVLMSVFSRGREKESKKAEYLAVLFFTLVMSVWIFLLKGIFPLELTYVFIIPLAWVAVRHSMTRALLLFTLFVIIAMSGYVLHLGDGGSAPFPLLAFTLMSVAYGLVLLILTTMKRSAEESLGALQASERKLSTLFAAMAEMVVLHELVRDEGGNVLDYRIIDCNRAFTEITGIPRESAIKRLASELYGSDEAPFLKEYSRVAISGEPVQFTMYYPPMDRHFIISAVCTQADQFATITVDITDMKRVEDQIARMNTQLKLKNTELEQLVYVASHDLRSPLVNIDGYSRELGYSMDELGTLLTQTAPESAGEGKTIAMVMEEMETSLRYIRGSAGRMDQLLSGLLKLSRSGRSALQIGSLDMNVLISSVLEGMEYRVQAAGIEVKLTDLPPCRGDRIAVGQVFANLIDNALKYLHPARPGKIGISGIGDGMWSVYTVEDNGVGIAADHQGKIFELFHRLEPERHEGEGLGLNIVKQALDRMEGKIEVDSEPGRGSRFIVSLPAPEGRSANDD